MRSPFLVRDAAGVGSLLNASRATRGMTGAALQAAALRQCQPSCSAHVSHPANDLHGRDAIEAGLWAPLAAAFPDLERRVDLRLTGRFADADWIASMGHFVGGFEHDLWGVRATRRPAWLRFGCFDRVEDGQIAETYLIVDLPALMIATGQWPLSRSLGAELLAPSPATDDNLEREEDPASAAKSLALVEAMIAGLMQYDGRSLASMGMRRFWTPDFHWYGPGGIGMARGHDDYERAHQGPFLAAFPDRRGGDHKCRIGDGAYVASTGWPSIRATHTGGGWLGLATTGRPVTMRVMDFWRRDGDLLAENWVFIDILDLAQQMGVDILARAAALRD